MNLNYEYDPFGLIRIDADLWPATDYKYTLWAFTAAVGGANEPLDVSMLDAVPDGLAAPHVALLAPGTMLALWQRPLFANGVLLTFVLESSALRTFASTGDTSAAELIALLRISQTRVQLYRYE